MFFCAAFTSKANEAIAAKVKIHCCKGAIFCHDVSRATKGFKLKRNTLHFKIDGRFNSFIYVADIITPRILAKPTSRFLHLRSSYARISLARLVGRRCLPKSYIASSRSQKARPAQTVTPMFNILGVLKYPCDGTALYCLSQCDSGDVAPYLRHHVVQDPATRAMVWSVYYSETLAKP